MNEDWTKVKLDLWMTSLSFVCLGWARWPLSSRRRWARWARPSTSPSARPASAPRQARSGTCQTSSKLKAFDPNRTRVNLSSYRLNADFYLTTSWWINTYTHTHIRWVAVFDFELWTLVADFIFFFFFNFFSTNLRLIMRIIFFL